MEEQDDLGIAEMFGELEITDEWTQQRNAEAAAAFPRETGIERILEYIGQTYARGVHFTIPQILAVRRDVDKSVVYNAVHFIRDNSLLRVHNAEQYRLHPDHVHDPSPEGGDNCSFDAAVAGYRQADKRIMQVIGREFIGGNTFTIYDIIYEANDRLRFAYLRVEEAVRYLLTNQLITQVKPDGRPLDISLTIPD